MEYKPGHWFNSAKFFDIEYQTYLKELAMVFTNALFFFGYAYLTVYFLIPRFMLHRKIFLFILLFLAVGLALSLLKFVFSDFIFFQAIAPESSSLGGKLSLSALLINTKDMTFIVAIFALVRFARDHYILESNILELQKKSLEAELKQEKEKSSKIQQEAGAAAESGGRDHRVADHQRRVGMGVLDRMARLVRRNTHGRQRLFLVHIGAEPKHLVARVVMVA